MPLFGISEHITELFLDKSELDIFFGAIALYEGSYDGILANLKSLSISNCAGGGPEKLKRIIIPSLESRSLEVLQLNPYPLPLVRQRAPGASAGSAENNNSFDWLRNKSVQHLTVGGLNLRHGLIDLDATLTAIVAQCERLASLDIGQEAVAAATLVAFIKKKEEPRRGGGVRALWHNNPELPTYDLQAWVRDKDLGEVHRRGYPGASDELWKRLYDW